MNHFEIVKATELFRNVSDGGINKIVTLCVEKKYAKDSVIMEEGHDGDEFYILPHGLVAIDVRISGNTYRRRAYEVMQGDVFGELALFGHRSSARVRALEAVTILAIPCAPLKQLMRDVPQIGYYAMSNLSALLAERLVMANISRRSLPSA